MKTTREEKAFIYYYNLGHSRTLQQVADEFKISLRTAKSWSGTGEWKRRVKEEEAKALAELTEQTAGLIKETNIKLQKELIDIMDLVIKKYKETLADPDTRIYAKDVSLIIDLFLKLNQNTVLDNNNKEEVEDIKTEEELDMIRNLTININNLIDKANEEVGEEECDDAVDE